MEHITDDMNIVNKAITTKAQFYSLYKFKT